MFWKQAIPEGNQIEPVHNRPAIATRAIVDAQPGVKTPLAGAMASVPVTSIRNLRAFAIHNSYLMCY
jgi:hypothetical protein